MGDRNDWAQLVRYSDGAAVSVCVGGWRNEGRVTFRGQWPKRGDGRTYSFASMLREKTTTVAINACGVQDGAMRALGVYLIVLSCLASCGAPAAVQSATAVTRPVTDRDADGQQDASTTAGKCPNDLATAKQIQGVIGQHQSAIQLACWERSRAKDDEVIVRVSVTIGPDGRSRNVTASGDEPTVAHCVEKEIRSWVFPGRGCSQDIEFAYRFIRTEPDGGYGASPRTPSTTME
jgi:hypothetical protein